MITSHQDIAVLCKQRKAVRVNLLLRVAGPPRAGSGMERHTDTPC